MEFLNGFACLVGGMLLREVLNELEIELCSVKGILIWRRKGKADAQQFL